MVYHVLNNGTVTQDITGYVVKVEDAEPLYELISNLKGSRKTENEKGGLRRVN